MMRFHRTTTFALLGFLTVLAMKAATITDLGTLGGPSSEAWAINDAGQIVGIATTATSGCSLVAGQCGDAFLWSAGSMTDLAPLGFAWSIAQGINGTGQIVGHALPTGASYARAILWSGGNTTDLGTLGGGGALAKAINGVGQITGRADRSDGQDHAYLYSGSSMTDLGTLGGSTSLGYGINSSGQVVGISTLNGNACCFPSYAFLWSGGVMTDLGTLGGSSSDAEGINSNGQVVGISQLTGDASATWSQAHAYLYSGGSMTDLGTLGGSYSGAYGINDAGQIVGESTTNGVCNTLQFCGHAFLYSRGFMTDLNSLLPANSGWVLTIATAINNIGGIVGFGTLNGQVHGFLVALTPRYDVCPLYDPTKTVQSGATIPIKLQLCSATGNDLSSSAIALHATSITQFSTSISGVVQGSGNANPDNDFRFDATLGPTGGYIFNLRTKGLTTGTYNLNFTVTGDSAVYAAAFQVK